MKKVLTPVQRIGVGVLLLAFAGGMLYVALASFAHLAATGKLPAFTLSGKTSSLRIIPTWWRYMVQPFGVEFMSLMALYASFLVAGVLTAVAAFANLKGNEIGRRPESAAIRAATNVLAVLVIVALVLKAASWFV